MAFAHEKLQVYHKSLDFLGAMQPLLSSWSKQHAFVDHLSRALESILFNLVEATRLRLKPKKLLTLDYALGSTFECAACIDIAALKGLLDSSACTGQKKDALEVCKMLVGLRHSWDDPRVAENRHVYSTEQSGQSDAAVFRHETLDMYRVMLDFYRWFVSTEGGRGLSSAFERSVDVLATRILLNIAEGNGRYSRLSRQGFLDTANAAVAKLAACLDMGARRNIWTSKQTEDPKLLLVRVGQMTARKDYS